MVDHPALLVTPDGTLHTAWVRAALPGTWLPQGIFYSRSDDGGESWTPPEEMAREGYDWPRLALAGGRVHLLYVATNGGVWHCWDDLQRTDAGWSVATRIRGWDSVSGPIGLAVTGPTESATMHLAGTDSARGALLYSAWDGAAWSAVETFLLGPTALTGMGAAAAAPPQGGRLAVALLATANDGGNPLPAVFGIARAIPDVDLELLPTPAPTRTPVITPTATPSPTPIPSPTPNLNTPVASGPAVDPRILGAGLATVVVLGVLALWGVRRARGRA